METGPSVAGALLAEYQQLKEEQRQRIGTRDHLVYATLGVLAMIVAGAVKGGAVALLLFCPPSCVALGWTYLVNDERVTALARYLERDLAPRLGSLLASPGQILGWERAHRAEGYRLRKNGQLGVDLLIFFVPGVAAAGAVIILADRSTGVVAAALLEVVTLLPLAYGFVRHSRAALRPWIREVEHV